MTYQEWQSLKSIRSEDNQRAIRNFERSNPGLAALFAKKEREELVQMRQAMTIDDRKERWKRIAEVKHNPTFAERRRREEK